MPLIRNLKDRVKSQTCSQCGSTNIRNVRYSVTKRQVSNTYKCSTCGYEWTQIGSM